MTDRARITEVAPDHHSISIYVPEFNLRFNHFLIKDEEPLLFHIGMKQMFPLVRDAVARVIDPSALRWISFSHFEADECGAVVSVNDFAIRQARVLAQDEILTTGTYRFRFLQTPHVPHNWEASLLFEEVTHTLLCSDLFTHEGDVEAVTGSDVVGRAKQALILIDKGAARAFCEPLPLYAIDCAHHAQTSRSSAETVGSYAWVHLCRRRRTGVARLGNRHAGSAGAWH